MSKINLELLPLQAYTVSGVGAAIDVQGYQEMVVTVHVTTGSGTLSAFSVYLEGSDDDGTTWYELEVDTVVKASGAAADVTPSVQKRNIVTESAIVTADTKWSAQYRNFPDKVRARWIITPTAAPSETFGVKAVART